MNKSLGISFSGDNIFFTELVSESGAIRLEHVEEVKTEFNFEDELHKHKSNTKDLTNISGEIQNYLTKRNIKGTEVSVTIGASQAFLITLPIDYSEGKQSINSKIYWELSNYFPDTYNDFVINTYRLNTVLPCKYSDEFLIIAVPKNSLEFVRRIFKICNVTLKVVDIDHFAAENSFRLNYSEQSGGKNILLIGLKKGSVDYGYITDKKYKFYSSSRYYSEPEFNLSIVRKVGSLLNGINFKNGVDTIFLYGDDVRDDTVEALKKLNKADVQIINPFQSITASDIFLKDENLRKKSYKFAPSCGVALRSLTAG